MMIRVGYELELAETIDATIMSGADAVVLGPTDATIASRAIRAVAPVLLPPITNAMRRFQAASWRVGAPERRRGS